MAVYVDPIEAVSAYQAGCFGARYLYSCNLLADTKEELEAAARRLKLRKSWRHDDHYDLTRGKRAKAVALGAIEIDHREMVRVRQRWRGTADNGQSP